MRSWVRRRAPRVRRGDGGRCTYKRRGGMTTTLATDEKRVRRGDGHRKDPSPTGGYWGGDKSHMDYMRTFITYERSDPLERLLAQTERDANGCLVYTGKDNMDGYAHISTGDTTVLGHRLVYEREVGPIPVGHQIHHTCHNRACIEITHLQCLTVREHHHAHGRGVGPCRKCGSDDWREPKPGTKQSRQCRECHRRRDRARRAARSAA